jgi:hypothetical protein
MIGGLAAQGYQRTCGAGPSTPLRFTQDDGIFGNEFRDDSAIYSKQVSIDLLSIVR